MVDVGMPNKLFYSILCLLYANDNKGFGSNIWPRGQNLYLILYGVLIKVWIFAIGPILDFVLLLLLSVLLFFFKHGVTFKSHHDGLETFYTKCNC